MEQELTERVEPDQSTRGRRLSSDDLCERLRLGLGGNGRGPT